MREDLPEQSACQMPRIARPHLLRGVALCELRKNGVYAVAKPAEEGTPSGIRISLLGGIGGQKLYAHLRQLFLGLGRVVVAVSDEKARGPLGDLWEHGEFVGVGRGYRDAGDHSRPGYPHVHPKAVEGLLEEGVFAEDRFPAEAPAADK